MSDEIKLTKTILPQNIQALIGEIGEKQVLLRLAIITHGTSWEVFSNLGESGNDVLLFNSVLDKRIRIEVKTRQKLFTTGKSHRRAKYILTDKEYNACDFLVGYFIDNNGFYIVPKSDLRPVKANGKRYWCITLPPVRQGDLHLGDNRYLDAWSTLHPDLKQGW